MITLHRYQCDAVQAVADIVNAGGKTAPLIVAPTGAGKTIVACEIARRAVANAGGRVLWLAHRRELITQAAERLPLFGLSCGEIMPGGREDPHAAVQIASIQTLLSRGTDGLPEFTHVIVDECHHYASDEWGFIRERWPRALLFGFTATPCRGDGRGLGAIFDHIEPVSTIRELTTLGQLVPCVVDVPTTILTGRRIAKLPVDAYLAPNVRGRKTVVFAQYVDDAVLFTEQFRARGIEAECVHGKLSIAERERALRAHTHGNAVLVNVGVLTEGWDSPLTSACILARGCSTVGIYLQIVGRILRRADGKRDAILIDLTGRAVASHGEPAAAYDAMLDEYGLLKRSRMDREPGASVCLRCSKLLEDGCYPCAECGYDPSSTHEGIAVANVELVRYANKRSEDADKRVETLARWFAEGRANGHKEFASIYKYKHVYGQHPTNAMIASAKQTARMIACLPCSGCGKRSARLYAGDQCGKCRYKPKPKPKPPSVALPGRNGSE